LANFFFGQAFSQDDCHAHHFSELQDFTSNFPVALCIATHEVSRLGVALNKFLVHFSSKRWETRREDWNFYDVYTPILEDMITRFEAALPPDIRLRYDRSYERWKRSSPVFFLT
jgi:hypothetical protein